MKYILDLRANILSFMSRHWFKISIVMLVLYAFFSRDFSLNISVHSPTEQPQQWQQPANGGDVRKETLTDNALATQHTSNRFDLLPDWSSDDNALVNALAEVSNAEIKGFIERFSHVAQTEQEKFGIPASITIGHALLQSQAGKKSHAARGHNFFQLPCTDDWDAGTQDGPNGCLRRYDNAWLSFRDHSLFYSTGKHTRLREIGAKRYAQWAQALEESPYNETGELATQLVGVIERFELMQYD